MIKKIFCNLKNQSQVAFVYVFFIMGDWHSKFMRVHLSGLPHMKRVCHTFLVSDEPYEKMLEDYSYFS